MNTIVAPIQTAFALLLLFLVGCIDNPTKEDRLACLELTSYSFAHLPDCASPEKCFAEADTAFRVNDKFFVAPVRQELYEAKSHVARAWLFLNNAETNLRQMHSTCVSGQSFSGIPQQANELKANLLVVGQEIDSFSASAAKAILLEAHLLEAEDINLVKDTGLFDDYVLLNQNIIDFSTNNRQGNSYASVFLREAEKFRAIASSLSLPHTVQEKNAYGLIAENRGKGGSLLEAVGIKKKDFPVSFLAPVFFGVSSFLNNYLSLSGSVAALRELPPAKIFESLNNIIGSENSAASYFFGLFANDSQHRQELLQRNSSSKIKALEMLHSAKKKIRELNEDFGGKIHAELLSLDANFSGVTSTTAQFNELEEFSSRLPKRVSETEDKLKAIEHAEYSGSLTLGKTSREISMAMQEAEELMGEVELLEESFSAITETCGARLGQIAKQLGGEEFRSENPIVVSAKARASARISSFDSTKAYKHCSSALDAYKELLSYLDAASIEEKFSKSLALCLADAEKLLVFDSGGIAVQLDSLKRMQRPYPNPDLVLQSCLGVKERLQGLLDLNNQNSALQQKPVPQGQNTSSHLEPRGIIVDENKIVELERRLLIATRKEHLLEKAFDLNAGADPLIESFAKIDSLVSEQKLGEAEKALEKLREKLLGIAEEKQSSVSLQEKASEELENAAALEEMARQLEGKVSLLEKIFSALGKEELQQVYAYSPITMQRYKGLVEFSRKNLGSAEKLSEKMASLFSSQEHKKLIGLAEKSGLEQKLSETRNAAIEVEAAVDRLKESALSSYEVAASKARHLPSEEAEARLLASRKLLEDKSYLKSILESQEALSELNSAAAVVSHNEIPFAVYPVLALVIGIALYIYRKTGEQDRPKTEVAVKKFSEREQDD